MTSVSLPGTPGLTTPANACADSNCLVFGLLLQELTNVRAAAWRDREGEELGRHSRSPMASLRTARLWGPSRLTCLS